MASKKISQREAREYKQRIEQLVRERRQLLSGTGTRIWNIYGQVETTKAVMSTAATLGHVIRAELDGDTLRLYAVKL